MIDIHSHILYGIDDGAKTREESIAILKKMQEIGFQIVVATPHYIPGSSYVANNKTKRERLKEVKSKTKEEGIAVRISLGNEIFIDHSIDKLIKKNEIAKINDTKYILVEFPRNTQVFHLMDALFRLRNKGYVPIVAHPERYLFLQEDYSVANQFLEMGCLLQGNLGNILGMYGKESEKLFRYLLKNNKYQFLATDIHHETDSLLTNFSKVKAEIVKIIGEKHFQVLTYKNPAKVLRDEIIPLTEISPIIKRFGKWK